MISLNRCSDSLGGLKVREMEAVAQGVMGLALPQVAGTSSATATDPLASTPQRGARP